MSARVEHHDDGGGERRDALARRAPVGNGAALAVDGVLGRGQLLDVVGGIGHEQRVTGVDHLLTLGAVVGDRPQDVVQLLLAARVAVDARARHELGVLLAVPRDRQVRDHGEAGGERLHAGEAARVLDERVGRGHERGHLVGPADHGAEAALVELGAELLVASTHRDGVELTRLPDRLDGGDDVADAPRARDHEHRAVVGIEAEAAAHRVAVVLGDPEPVTDERAARDRRPCRHATARRPPRSR